MSASFMPRCDAESTTTRRASILVVDDDEELRLSVADVLAQQGYSVQACGDALEALVQLQKRQAPDLILLDLHMPRMNGWDFCTAQQTQSELAGIPVVVLSGDPFAASRAPHAHGYLSKPVNREGLLSTIERVLVEHSARDDRRADREALANASSHQLLQLSQVVTAGIQRVETTQPPVHWVRDDCPALRFTGSSEALVQALGDLFAKASASVADERRVLNVTTLRLDGGSALIEVSGMGPRLEPGKVGAIFDELMSRKPACVLAFTIQQEGPPDAAPSCAAAPSCDDACAASAWSFTFRLEVRLRNAPKAAREAAERNKNTPAARGPVAATVRRRRRVGRLDS